MRAAEAKFVWVERAMIWLLMTAGIVAFVGGVFAIASGIPIKEFSFGNTMIIAGAVASGAGLILVGLAQVMREVRKLGATLPQRVTPAMRPDFPLRSPRPDSAPEPTALPDSVAMPPPPPRRDPVRPLPEGPVPGFEHAARESNVRESHEGKPDDAAMSSIGSAPPAAKPVPSPRNLLFRPPAAARADDEALPHLVDMPTSEARFDTFWPQAPRPPEGLWKRRRGTADTAAEKQVVAPEPEAPAEPAAAELTIIKSGVIEGMAYTLYSDGSIETQMAEGSRRFASIHELRIHLGRASE